MEFIGDLWLPILVGTVVLWFLSFLAWAVLPHHFGDHARLDNEDALTQFLRDAGAKPGNYMFPYCGSAKDQTTEEFVEKYTTGPRGVLNLYPMPNMALNMALSIAYFLVTVLTIGYITHVACPPGDEASTWMKVFRVAGTIGVLNYASSGVLHRIWFKAKIWTGVLDGVVYGIVLGLIFGWMWP